MHKKHFLKIIIVLIFIICLYLGFDNSIIIEMNKYNYSYPELGFIPDEETAVALATVYLKKYISTDEFIENLYAIYDEKLNVWKVKSKLPEKFKNDLVTDGGPTIIMRKKDGKILYFSLYQ